MEDYVKEARELLDAEVDELLDTLDYLAVKHNLEREWVYETFRDKLVYKLKKMIPIKGRI